MRIHNLYDGKYTVYHDNGILKVDRYRTSWPEGNELVNGCGLILSMIQRIEELEDKLTKQQD